MNASSNNSDSKLMLGRHYQITGIVQGVGFRPFVYQTAIKYHLKGDVCNSANGVIINVFGHQGSIDSFHEILQTAPPPRARIDHLSFFEVPFQNEKEFRILPSQNIETDFLPVSPDICICEACRNEIIDFNNRRFHYPFTNCTNCGPRFSIIERIPYDRPNTSMKRFPMCSSCTVEYENPLDRRFHAQPVACRDCGPQLTYFHNGSDGIFGDHALIAATESIKDGEIMAIKGIGGFHLACDAMNETALKRLRGIKHRSNKPFALMAKDIPTIQKYCMVNPDERALLQSAAAPIVLLKKKVGCIIPESVAPTQNELGFMIPYTPLHILLFEMLSPEIEVLVMTSANYSEEPIVFGDSEKDRTILAQLSDGILTHNRQIVTRIDDSVTRIDQDHQRIMIRRARGYAPDPILVQRQMNQILAAGPELKNTFCLTRGNYAFISHHIGDMENAETFQAYQEEIAHYKTIFRVTPEVIACDLHPNYLSTIYAEKLSEETGLPLIRIQHHYAHIASVLAENHCFNAESAIGLAFDGTGYGTDGFIWGGEALLCNNAGFERVYHLDNFPLPGGDTAIRKPYRQALALLYANGFSWEDSLFPVSSIPDREKELLKTQLDHRLNCVDTSSMGRLFDAISSLLGICQEASYEGQAAIELENVADPDCTEYYPFEILEDKILLKPVIGNILDDLRQGIPKSVISAKFHHGVIQLCLEICIRIREAVNLNIPTVLSGGVWQNQILLGGVRDLLEKNSFNVLLPRQLPYNDGCVSFGQAVIANEIKDRMR